ncbi:MAG: hypothetical protein ACFFBD_04975 [Candidatus Hodarchaeota archaeon]
MSEEKDEQKPVRSSIPQEEDIRGKLPLIFILSAITLVVITAMAWAIFLFPETIQLALIGELLASSWVFVVAGLIFWGLLELGRWKSLLPDYWGPVQVLWVGPAFLHTIAIVTVFQGTPLLALTIFDLLIIAAALAFTAILAWRSPIFDPSLLFLSAQTFLLIQIVLEQRAIPNFAINSALFVALPAGWLLFSAWKQREILFWANSFFAALLALNTIILTAGWPLLEISTLGVIVAVTTWWFKRPSSNPSGIRKIPDGLEISEKEPVANFLRFYAAPFLLWLTSSLSACLAWINDLLTPQELIGVFILSLGLVFITESVKKRGWWLFGVPLHGILLELTLVSLAVIGTENIDLLFVAFQVGLMILFAICILLRESTYMNLAITFSVCAVLAFLPLEELVIFEALPFHELFRTIGLIIWLVFIGALELRDWMAGIPDETTEKVHWSRLAILLCFMVAPILSGLITDIQLIAGLGAILFVYGIFKRLLWHRKGRKAGEEALIPFVGAFCVLIAGILTGTSPVWIMSLLVGIFCVIFPILELALPRSRHWISTSVLALLPIIFAITLLVPNENLAEWQVVVILSTLAAILGGTGMEFVSTGASQKIERWILLFGSMGGILLSILIAKVSFEMAIIPIAVFSATLMSWTIVRKPITKDIFAISTCFPPIAALFALFLVQMQIIIYQYDLSFPFAWVVMSLLSNGMAFQLERIPDETVEKKPLFALPVIVEAANSISLAGFYALGVVTTELFIFIWGFFVILYLAWRLVAKRGREQQHRETFVNVIVAILVITFFALAGLIVRPMSELPLELLTVFFLLQTIYLAGIRLTSRIPERLHLLEIIRPSFLAGCQILWCLIVQTPLGWPLVPLLLILASEMFLTSVNVYRENLMSEQLITWFNAIVAVLVGLGSFLIYQSSLGGDLLGPLDSVLLEALIPTGLLGIVIAWLAIFLLRTNIGDITPQFSIFSIIALVSLLEIGLWLDLLPIFTGLGVLVFSLGFFALRGIMQNQTKITWLHVENFTFITALAIITLLDAFNPFNGAIIVALGAVLAARGIFQKQNEYLLSGGTALIIGIVIVFWEIWSRTIVLGTPISFIDVVSLTVATLLVVGLVGLYQLSKQQALKSPSHERNPEE